MINSDHNGQQPQMMMEILDGLWISKLPGHSAIESWILLGPVQASRDVAGPHGTKTQLSMPRCCWASSAPDPGLRCTHTTCWDRCLSYCSHLTSRAWSHHITSHRILNGRQWHCH